MPCMHSKKPECVRACVCVEGGVELCMGEIKLNPHLCGVGALSTVGNRSASGTHVPDGKSRDGLHRVYHYEIYFAMRFCDGK